MPSTLSVINQDYICFNLSVSVRIGNFILYALFIHFLTFILLVTVLYHYTKQYS